MSTDSVSYAILDHNYLTEGEGTKPGHENFVNYRYKFVISLVYNFRLFKSSKHKDIFRISGKVKQIFKTYY